MVDIITFKDRIKTPLVVDKLHYEGVKATALQRAQGYPEYLISPYTFKSEMFILNRVDFYSTDSLYITFFQNGTKCCATVPKNFKVKEVRNIQSRLLMNEYDNYLINNITNNLTSRCYSGSDPEIFITDSKNELIPAFEFLGSKKVPTLVRGMHKCRTNLPIYWDGFQAEFETEPNSCLSFHIDSIQAQLDNILTAAKKYKADAKLSIRTIFDVSPEVIAKTSDEHVAFGCMPSYNAYGLKGNPLDGRDVFFRSTGGHLHFGFYNVDGLDLKQREAEANRIVKALDAILGVACVSLFASFDDPRRRQLYGLAGEYRLPKHGLEYRTLSNAWLCHPLITNIVFDLARRVISFGNLGLHKFWDCPQEETIRIIQECDVEAARKVLDKNKDLMIKIITTAYNNSEKTNHVFNMYRNGVESVIADPTDLVNNWCLTGSGKTWVTHCDGPGKQVTTAVRIINDKKKVS